MSWKMCYLHHFLVLASTDIGTRPVPGSINLSSKMVNGCCIYLAFRMMCMLVASNFGQEANLAGFAWMLIVGVGQLLKLGAENAQSR
jgi:hypothetical protein